jgi:hypothetical protein
MPGPVEFAYPREPLGESCLKHVTFSPPRAGKTGRPHSRLPPIRLCHVQLLALPTAVLYVVFLLRRPLMLRIRDILMNAGDVFPRCGVYAK